MSTQQPTGSILVTGGTGTLGRLVVERLLANGQRVRVLSRHGADMGADVEQVIGDLATGEGVDAAVQGTEVIIHIAGSQKGDDEKARRLVEAAKRAGSPHLVYISVVGADRIPVSGAVDRAMFGYFAAKGAAERIIAESGLPWTTLRSTQFHELTLNTVRAMAKMPVVPAPRGWRFQPIDAGEVADRLVELALAAPAGLVPAIGGPRIYEMADLVRSYLRATNSRRPILRMPTPGKAAAVFRAGANLAPDRAVGRRTWEDFLAAEVAHRSTAIEPDMAGEARR